MFPCSVLIKSVVLLHLLSLLALLVRERLGKEGGCVRHSEEMRVSVFGNILYGNCCCWFELVIRGRAIMIIMVDNNGTIECGLNYLSHFQNNLCNKIKN